MIGVILTLPALYKAPNGVPVAFYAVVSIGVIGLYVACSPSRSTCAGVRATTRPSSSRPVDPGQQVQVDGPLALIEIPIVTSIYFLFRPCPQGWLLHETDGVNDFSWVAVNYTPIVVIGVSGHRSGGRSRRRTGSPGRSARSTCPPACPRPDEIALEHHHDGYLTGEHQQHHPTSNADSTAHDHEGGRQPWTEGC